MTSRFWLGIVIAALATTNANAWGPHTEITRAALEVLPENEQLKKSFGDDWDRIAKDYCWMGDWREAVRPDHYADDYLLFPGVPRHFSHMPPEVRKTFEPFFRRALQALRTETPQNAARWIGSLLHFVQDSGSPPHAANVGGETHGKMERWVDESKIRIDGYRPKLLGKTDEEALKGFQERMAGLHEFAKPRGEKLKPIVEKLASRENQPLELECALEVARVSADVMHTLFTLGSHVPKTTGSLKGAAGYSAPAGYASVPAKVVLAGTTYSTTTDREGRFEFRHVPSGKYDVWLMATGHVAEVVRAVEVSSGKVVQLERKLKADVVPGNLVRNPTFLVKWVQSDQPDAWYADSTRKGRWASALIRVPVEQRCRLRVEFREKEVPIAIRWRTDPSKAAGREVQLSKSAGDPDGRLAAEFTPDPLAKPFEKGFLFLEVLIQSEKPLAEVCGHVAVVFTR